MFNIDFSPVLSPSMASASTASLQDVSPLVRGLSASSVQSLAELIVGTSANASSSSVEGEYAEAITVEGLRHSDVHLEARRYKTENFASRVLACIRQLRVPSWSGDFDPQGLKVQKVSGSMTNAVFFVSYPSRPKVHTLLLRVYGPSSGSLISRPRELHNLHILSSKYNIGPKVYGTFENGRLEEYFESTTLQAADMRDPITSSWIGSRMAEFHSVDLDVIEESAPEPEGTHLQGKNSATTNVDSWIPLAKNVLALPAVSDTVREALDLDTFTRLWKAYTEWLRVTDDATGLSRRVFAHNDAQYGNLLRRLDAPPSPLAHHQIIVVDFEYAGPNPAAYDVANHFHEWTADYHGPTPHLLDPLRYPSEEERHTFYRSYLRQAFPKLSNAQIEGRLSELDEQVRIWSPASHAMWAIWGIVQARDDLESGTAEPEFDYLGYSACRMELFAKELERLGIHV
ncbi:protein kinase subdomain-containing protein PKL/CAK/ChoK [Cylindrobasidium torrendii FP15055 ss-10]|uniref:Protein kinase subdomain-containing protein PKL/CAK/ChoK n=1 Tax=Cylindrobasidium torrendii FP15055 ss-10 TaxID=1314674 RepID=A0A0D7BI07_9AGAR|nr:protein kinase subdomain-containing protein PKL/CAK/ChoK [Cylindrobasidium torrendii FP15055 ss-10]